MSEFSMRVRCCDVPDDAALSALVRDEAERLGMDPDSVIYYTRDAYRLDSGTHIDYAFDVFASVPVSVSTTQENT